MMKTILVTGATGFIGSHIAEALYSAGHQVIGAVRSPEYGQQLNPDIQYIACDFAKDHSVEAWSNRLDNVDVVINVVGIITESGKNSFEAIHAKGSKALFAACEKLNIQKVIHISALGVSDISNTGYNNTKQSADSYLHDLAVPSIILRPSWLYGQRSRSFEVLSAFSALPVIPVTDSGSFRVQPIYVKDLAIGIVQLVERDLFINEVVEIGGPEQLSIKSIHELLRAWLQLPKTKILSMPSKLVKYIVKVGDHLFKGPINTASFDMLTRENITLDNRFWNIVGHKPNKMRDYLNRHPAIPAETWYARLFFVMPLLQYTLALMWVLSGVLPLFFIPQQQTLSLLDELGFTGDTATVLFYFSCVLDICLGAGMFLKRCLKLICFIQILVVLGYTCLISLNAPHWWLHPYAPILKNIPLLVATMVIALTTRRR